MLHGEKLNFSVVFVNATAGDVMFEGDFRDSREVSIGIYDLGIRIYDFGTRDRN